MNEYLSELRNRFGYDDDLLKAIEITINLMIQKYGDDQKSEIYSLFAGVKIIPLSEIDHNVLEDINKHMNSFNRHIVFTNNDNPYGCDLVASAYNYEPIFSADMQVVDEVRLIVTQDMKGRFNEEDYRKVFGTSINMPYFIHEANHAYAMMHPEYKYEGNKVIMKHGMYTSVYEYTMGEDNKYMMTSKGNDDIILEDAINEKITQDMLIKLLNKKDYKEVKDILNEIHHVGTEYGIILLTLGELFEEKLGSNVLMDYRRNNNHDVITYFNEQASKSDIVLEYLNGEEPFNYFSKIMYQLFSLSVNKYKMRLEDYSYETAKLMMEAFAPLSAFEEIEYGTMNKEKYNQRREHVLSSYTQHQSNGLTT